jgi:hypothetical protein
MDEASGAVFTTVHFLCYYKWAQYARVLDYTRLEKLAREKHSRLSDPFINDEENAVL